MNKWNFGEKIITLENGLKIITIKKDTKLAAINIGVKIGSLYEEENERGVSHFIEHMMFKGTETRNNEKLNNELEFLAGEYNAYTDYTSTVYSIACLEEEIENATELLGDMMINSSFLKEEMKKEKGVILAEIRTSNDDVEDLSFRRANELGFNKSPLKNEILGSSKTVSSFKREDLLNYYKKYYTPDNAVISMVSSLDHEVMQTIIKKFFSKWEGICHKKGNIIMENNNSLIEETFKHNIEQCTVTYLYSLKDLEKEDELALKILNHKLGESSNSLLFRELREKRGLAYDVYTYLDLSKNVKTLHIFTAISEDVIDETIDVIDKCIEDIKEKRIIVDYNTLELMKKVHKTAIISTMENSSDLCNYVLHQLLDDEDIYEFNNDMEKLNNLTEDDIYKVASKLLNKPTVHILRNK